MFGHYGDSGLDWPWGTGKEGKRKVGRVMGKVETKGDGGSGVREAGQGIGYSCVCQCECRYICVYMYYIGMYLCSCVRI